MEQSGIKHDKSWDTFWEVSTIINEEEWFAEFKIPLSSLGYQNTNEQIEMGLIARRWMPDNNEMTIYPNISPELGEDSYNRLSNAIEIILRNIKDE